MIQLVSLLVAAMAASLAAREVSSLNSLVKLQQMFKTAETELGMENTIGITLETGVGDRAL